MLKGFVSGEEKDIKRIAMKTRNLWANRGFSVKPIGLNYTHNISNGYGTTLSTTKGNEVTITQSAYPTGNVAYQNGFFMIDVDFSKYAVGSVVTISFDYIVNEVHASNTQQSTSVYAGSDSNAVSNTLSSGDWKISGRLTAKITVLSGMLPYVEVRLCGNSITVKNIMLNLGSTALPYEPYGYQEGWEVRDNQDRILWGREDELQTATGTLPFKGYSLPLKVKSILGNAVQNGTPSPSPVNLNLVDPSATVPGYQESNGSIHEPTSGNERTTDWIPFTTDALYAIVSGSNSGNINWVLYDSSKQPLYFYGPTFSPNTVIIISRSGYSTAAFIRISWTNAANQPICVTTEQRSEYIAFDPNPPGPVIPEMCGVRTGNLFDVHKEWVKSSNTDTVIVSGNSVTITSKYYAKVKIPVPKNTDCVIKANVFEEGETTTGTAAIYESDSSTRIIYSVISEIKDVPFNTGNNDEIWVYLYASNGTEKTKTYSEIMLNLGSTALPYEPYGWKVPFENHGENLFDIPEKSATMQSLQTLVDFGEDVHFDTITASLLFNDVEAEVNGAALLDYLKDDGTHQYVSPMTMHEISTGDAFPRNVKVSGNYYVEKTDITFRKIQVYLYSSGYNKFKSGTIKFAFYDTSRKDYSPYLNETIPVYLGEVPTVRRVKKLVLDGTEAWSLANSCFILWLVPNPKQELIYCTHYKGRTPIYRDSLANGQCMVAINQNQIAIKDVSYETVEDFKAYLASEYAAGHPVTIWYVLNTEQTTISNEPLCKISTYADELTTIQVHGLSAPLYGIGDYKDTLNLSTGVVTRKVKRLVLDGTENIESRTSEQTGNVVMRLDVSGYMRSTDYTPLASHYVGLSAIPGIQAFVTNGTFAFLVSSSGSNYMYIFDNRYTTAADFKSYLAAQYANGTPVTIWYVLNTPETETVTVPTGMTGGIEGYLTQVSTPTPTNRSVPKWNGVEETGGTYAVTVYTPPEIPTTTGQNTLTVETEKIHGLTNPLCGIGDYKDVLNLSTGVITRKVKKLVLTGNETVTNTVETNTSGIYCFVYRYTDLQMEDIIDYEKVMSQIPYPKYYCSHFANKPAPTGSDDFKDISDGQIGANSVSTNVTYNRYLIICKSGHNNATSFKAWLAAQYQNGTPVTIWYVLETPETETITVPYGLECSVEGYLTQSTTPTPSSPITPDSNGVLESGGTYTVEVSLVPSSLAVKGHIKELT